jgi:hypothetical protein
VHFEAVHNWTRGSYGRPRILRELRHEGVRVGKQRLQRLMRKHGICMHCIECVTRPIDDDQSAGQCDQM